MSETEEIKVKLVKSGPPNDTIFVLGSTGSGKTTLIANLLLKEKRFICFDTKNDFPCDYFPSPCYRCNTEYHLTQLLNTGCERIIVDLSESKDIDADFAKFCRVIYGWHLKQDGRFTTRVCVDELNRFADVNNCPDTFTDLILRGRSVGVTKLFGASWFSRIPTWIRDTFTELYTFRHTDENGLRILAQFGFDDLDVAELENFSVLYRGKNQQRRLRLVSQTA